MFFSIMPLFDTPANYQFNSMEYIQIPTSQKTIVN